jgi:hypothetical protein
MTVIIELSIIEGEDQKMAKIYRIRGNQDSIKIGIVNLNEIRQSLIYPIEIEIEGHHTSYFFADSAQLDYFRAGYELASQVATH